MKSLVGLISNKYYHKVNDNLESVFEIGLLLAETEYKLDGKTTSKEYEVEVNRFMLTKKNADDMIEFLSNLKHETFHKI